jgi:hypothetical protein
MMTSGPEEPIGHEALRSLDGPADDDLEYSGPGHDGTEPVLPASDPAFPGGVDHTTAAAGAGALGIVLLWLVGLVKRRRTRRRLQDLDA